MGELIAGNVIRRFDEYLRVRATRPTIHPAISAKLCSLDTPHNLIIYGRKSIGKYYLAMDMVRKFSPLDLQYEKMMPISYNKKTYTIRISDVHFEIDMQMLGTNSRLIWQSIFTAVLDIAQAAMTKSRTRFIMLKNFQDVSSEMYDLLLCYIDDRITKPANIYYIVITESISLLHNEMLDKFAIVQVPVPSEAALLRMNGDEVGLWKRPSAKISYNEYEVRIFQNLMQCIDGFTASRCVDLRNGIYDVLIYNLSPLNIIFRIMRHMMIGNDACRIAEVFFRLNDMMIEYNNNYRPIIHLERFVIYFVDVLGE